MGFPNFPGVPALKSGQIIAGSALLASGLLQKGLNFFKPQWGLYKADGKTLALQPDNFVSIDYQNVQNVSQYPVERGSFTSYNKVQTPFRAVVKVSKGGSKTDRAAFISAVESLNASLDLYWLITPEKTYKNVNLERYDYRRDAMNGAGLMVVSLYLVEIREAQASSSTTNAQSPQAPSAQSNQSNGQVQAGPSAAKATGVQ